MEIVIKGDPKEIATFALEMQKPQNISVSGEVIMSAAEKGLSPSTVQNRSRSMTSEEYDLIK